MGFFVRGLICGAKLHGTGGMGKAMRALGLMSGTSLDGVDVALLDTDGENVVERGPAMTFPYDAETRALLVSAIVDAKSVTRRDARPGCLPDAERRVTEQHAAAIEGFLRRYDLARESIDIIGFHGQTVLHRPATAQLCLTANGKPYETVIRGRTIQLGLGPKLAELTRMPVVYDMRAADVAAGGQGAPLAPVYHRALASQLPQRPIAIVNIGGVANVTWIGRDGRLIAFDVGPGNAMIDDWMMRRAGLARDEDGCAAAAGKVHDDIVRAYLTSAFFAAPAPKSLDRNAFASEPIEGLSVEDGAATLAAFTAGALARSREHMPEEPQIWVISGGGRRNRTIMMMLAGLVQHAVVPAEAAGFDGDAIEAEAWAYMAVRSIKGLPITFPGTTGVARPMTGGVLVEPQAQHAK
ncbi:MAG: anhydro-N-acetylmuramic acid kinase [Hyphomicrobium sp.]